jgi:hypothetical protein
MGCFIGYKAPPKRLSNQKVSTKYPKHNKGNAIDDGGIVASLKERHVKIPRRFISEKQRRINLIEMHDSVECEPSKRKM